MESEPQQPQGLLALFMSSRGRINRMTYFGGGLALAGVVLAAMVLDRVWFGVGESATLGRGPFALVAIVACIVPAIFLDIKRLHDRGLSGWWTLARVIPFFDLFLLLVPGQQERNRFGPVPRSNEGEGTRDREAERPAEEVAR